MKKFLLSFLFISATLLSFKGSSVEAYDPEISMGFSIDKDIWTDCKDYDSKEVWLSYGFAEVHSAVYQRKDGSKEFVIIYYLISEPLPKWYQSSRSDQNILRSDVDGASRPGPYGSYYSSSGFELMSPTPTSVPETTTYEVGLELSSSNPPVFGVVTSIDLNELEIDTEHSFAYEELEVHYNYSCRWLVDCSYSKDATEQKASFIANATNVTYDPYRLTFINESEYYVSFKLGMDSWIFTNVDMLLYY